MGVAGLDAQRVVLSLSVVWWAASRVGRWYGRLLSLALEAMCDPDRVSSSPPSGRLQESVRQMVEGRVALVCRQQVVSSPLTLALDGIDPV
jgi:hypothetical protein